MRLTSSLTPRPSEGLTSRDLVRAALTVIATLVVLQLLWSARFFVLTGFLGVLFGLSAARAVDAVLKRFPKLKRELVAVAVVLGVVALLILIALWTGPSLVEQSQELRTKLPEAIANLETWLAQKLPTLLDAIAPPQADGSSRLLASLSANAPALTNFAFGILQSTLSVAAASVLVVFLALYIAVDPVIYRRGMVMLVPIERREKFETLLTALASVLRTWFQTQLIAMLVIGVVTTLLLATVGVRAALPLGVLAGLFEFVPNVGPMLSAVPAVLMGFVDSPQKALLVVGLYWGIQFLENNLLIPYLMRSQLDLPPALTLITQVVMAFVFGFLGLFVAIPLLASVVVVVRMFWVDEELPPLPTLELPMPRKGDE
jgi:predicted PurR-regulated permease PerM